MQIIPLLLEQHGPRLSICLLHIIYKGILNPMKYQIIQHCHCPYFVVVCCFSFIILLQFIAIAIVDGDV